MKKVCLLFLATASLGACTPPVTQNAPAAATSAAPAPSQNTEQCYLHTEGKDSSFVHLTLSGKAVSGKYDWVPYEKDARRGTLSGTIDNNYIKVTWNYVQEGQDQQLPFEARLENGVLRQKDYTTNAATGQETFLPETGFTRTYTAVECR